MDKLLKIFFLFCKNIIHLIYIYIYMCVCVCVCVWNQSLVNLDFDDNKIRFRTNDHISSVIRQDDFQSGNHKDKSSQGEIMKKKTTSKRRVFQDQNFIRSLCKVVGALGLSCISFFIYAPKSSKSNIVLNIFKIGWFHVFN